VANRCFGSNSAVFEPVVGEAVSTKAESDKLVETTCGINAKIEQGEIYGAIVAPDDRPCLVPGVEKDAPLEAGATGEFRLDIGDASTCSSASGRGW